MVGKGEIITQLIESRELDHGGYESQLCELNNYSEKITIDYDEKL